MRLAEVPIPEPKAGQVAIDVRAIGCNFFDMLMVQGKYQVRPPLPFSPGGEVSGTVRSIGRGRDERQARRSRVRDARLGRLCGGRCRCRGQRGEDASLDVVRAWRRVRHRLPDVVRRARCIAPTCERARRCSCMRRPVAWGSPRFKSAARSARACWRPPARRRSSPSRVSTAPGQAFDYSTPDWVDRVKEATGGRGADVIYDPVGGDVFERSMKCIAFGGRLLVIGFASGIIPSIQANRILLKNISIVGLHWGAYRTHDPAKIGETMIALFALYERGAIRPVVSSIRPLAEAAAALDEIASRKSVRQGAPRALRRSLSRLRFATGTSTWNRDPASGRLSTWITPPSVSVKRRASASPMPSPPYGRSSPLTPWRKSWKIFPISASSMPMPVSSTDKTGVVPRAAISSATRPTRHLRSSPAPP